jgi:oxygen-dependent protoporphyrinogen oxidase
MIIIVGAGITGLSAGFELASRGVPFQILEASPRAGGLIRTEHSAGFTIEAGPDSVLVQKPAALELCDALGLTPRLIATNAPRRAFVLKRGRLCPLPSPSVLGVPTTLGGIAGYDLLSPIGRARLALEVLVPRRNADDESVGSFFRRRFGGETVGCIAEPLLGGIHAGNIETLSMKALFPRFLDAEARRGSVLLALRHTPRVPAGDGLFRSLAGGMSELVEALERRLPEGSLRYDTPVRAIARSDSRDGATWQVRSPGGDTRADAVIFACPAYVAAGLLAPVDAAAAARCAEVPYASSVSVALAWPRDAVAHPLQGSGFVVARRYNSVRITACTWVSSKWAGRAPQGSVLLRAFIGGSHDPGAVDLPDEELVNIAAREMAQVLGIQGPPIVWSVARWPRAGAQHNVGQIARVTDIEARLAAHRGLFVAGSGFRAVGIPDCIADGRAAAVRAADCTKINELAD